MDNTITHQVTIMPAIYGDANLDGVVNFSDLSKVLTNYNQTGMSWSQGDFNYDGIVNFEDLNKILTNYNLTGPLSINNLPVFASTRSRRIARRCSCWPKTALRSPSRFQSRRASCFSFLAAAVLIFRRRLRRA